MTHLIFRLTTLTCVLSILGCSTPVGFYAQPSTQQPHAVLTYNGTKNYLSAVPSLQVIEINGKTPPVQSSLLKSIFSYRLHPGPVHLFVQARSGRGVGASGHLDFVVRRDASYQIDLAVGMKDIAFLVTENGKTVATSQATKQVTRDPSPSSTPMFIPIVVD
ncbi:hypothetical protein SAMN02745166_02538 [Prosthecobacter debontii]|uniref:DUF2846 domain-containing protein n=1 Tax=Prosthecobacter debontii TaxID=48467 RepID=A0A1T4Y5T6_9BACT|nr:hypothetical protein [Prosthecobacter debontii]SKA97080.1 hypothetical protein SAMN02745166_02538 [Prosthecobacter debontii]